MKQLTAALFIIIFAIAAIACGITSQSAMTHAIDAAASVANSQPSAVETILESRQVAPADSGGRGAVGALVLAVFVIVIGAVVALLYYGRHTIDAWRKATNAAKRRPKQQRQRQAPIISDGLPPVRRVPPARQLEETYQ